MNWNFLIGPLVGAIIGYITNGVAIKMLFRPLKPIRIGNYTLPFTPGVIPKEKGRIAKSIGTVISRELLNEQVLREALLKEELFKEIENRIDDYIAYYLANEQTVEETLYELVGKEKSIFLRCEAEEQVTSLIYHKVVNMELGKIIVERLMQSLKEGTMSQMMGPMSFLVNEKMLQGIGEKIEPLISQMIINEAEEIIREAVEQEGDQLSQNTIGEWVNKVQPYNDVIKRIVLKMYKGLVNHGLSNALTKLDIADIVEKRIVAFDTLEMEKLILELMQKELNMIIWLGALLGGIMGCITSFF